MAAFSAIATVDASFPIPMAAGPITGVAFKSVVPIPVIAAALADTIFVAVPATAGIIYNLQLNSKICVFLTICSSKICKTKKYGIKNTFEAAPETTALAAEAATVLTADDTTEDAAPATAGIAALAALALAEANM